MGPQEGARTQVAETTTHLVDLLGLHQVAGAGNKLVDCRGRPHLGDGGGGRRRHFLFWRGRGRGLGLKSGASASSPPHKFPLLVHRPQLIPDMDSASEAAGLSALLRAPSKDAVARLLGACFRHRHAPDAVRDCDGDSTRPAGPLSLLSRPRSSFSAAFHFPVQALASPAVTDLGLEPAAAAQVRFRRDRVGGCGARERRPLFVYA